MHHISLLTDILLAITAAFAGFIDTLVGGGGLITLPALLGAGLPPQLALGTNRLQGCIGELNASIYFLRRGEIKLSNIKYGLLFAVVGSTLGTWVIEHLHSDLLNKLIPALLLCVLFYVIFSPKVTAAENLTPKIKPIIFFVGGGLILGFYNGFLGPATGTFWAVALMYFLRYDIRKATMNAKPLNFIGNVTSLFWFILAGHVLYSVALSMAAGQLIGSRLGSRLVFKDGGRIIRPIFIIVVTIMTLDIFIRALL